MNAQTTLTPLAVSAEPLLRAIQANPAATPKVLAEAAGRHANHIARDLKALEAAGFIALNPTELTGGGVAALEAIDRANGEPRSSEATHPAPEGLVTLVWAQIFPDPQNPRRDFDSDEAVEGIEELAASIDDVGEVLQNLVVRPLPDAERTAEYVRVLDDQDRPLPLYQLVSGERRWRAVRQLVQSGRRPETFPIPCKVRDLDDAKAKRWALIENLKRVDLKPMEEARAFRALVDDGMSTEAIAVEVLGHERKQRFVQQRMQLLELGAVQQELLDRGGLTVKEALELIRNRPKAIDLTDAQALLFLEVAEAMTRKGGWWAKIPVDHTFELAAGRKGTDAQWLKTYGQFSEDEETGGSVFTFANSARALLQQLTDSPNLVLGPISEALAKARLQAALQMDGGNPLGGGDPHRIVAEHVKAKRYFTAALNKPFAVEPTRKAAAADRRKAERARQKEYERLNAARQREIETAQAERERRTAQSQRDMGSEGRAYLADVLVFQEQAAALPVAEFQTAFSAFIASHEAQAPWGLTWDKADNSAGLHDAKGRPNAGAGPVLEARRRIIAIAINFAAGLAPHSGQPIAESPWASVDDEDPRGPPANDRPEFVSWIALTLQEYFPDWKAERCQSKAGHALNDDLKASGVEYGAHGLAWNRIAAQSIADNFAQKIIDEDEQDLTEDEEG